MTVKFIKNGKTKAILKDSAAEPEGIKYLEDNAILDDSLITITEGVKSLEELDAEAEKDKKQ